MLKTRRHIWLLGMLALLSGHFLGQDVVAESEFQPGYRVVDITYNAKSGARVSRKVSLWYPTNQNVDLPLDYAKLQGGTVNSAGIASGKYPIILFSHGLWSAPEFSSFIHEELAKSGFIVAAPHHADAVTELKNQKTKLPDFFAPDKWDETRHADRAEDVHFVLDALLAAQQKDFAFLRGHVQPRSVGAMGHSMGGYTVCGLLGGWPAWHDKRIDCGLLMSPYIHPFLPEGKSHQIDVPVMLQGAWPGDLGITPFLPAFYQKIPPPKYLLVLERENHFSWTNLVCQGKPTHEAVQGGSPEIIVRYSLGFFDRYLRGNKASDSILRQKDRTLNGYIFDDGKVSLK